LKIEWLEKTIRHERRALERARRRFVADPTEEHLHDVRTNGRRFRSLLEDVTEIDPHPKLLRRVKLAAAATDSARDAAIIRRLLESSTDPTEADVARPLADELLERERVATRRARKRLRRLSFLS
jgi:CHAD domain-containing protein